MAVPKNETTVQKVGTEAPSWLIPHAEADKSLDVVKRYRRLSRLRIAQGNTVQAKTLIKKVGEGSVVIGGGESVIATAGVHFQFVPLFMFTEYCKWRDRKDPEKPAVFEGCRTFDETSEIAMCARDRDRRWVNYGEPDKENPRGKFRARYVEHLCFPGVLYPTMEPITISFEKGEHFTGTNFCSAIMLRKIGEATAPLFTQVWDLYTEEHEYAGNTWWGYGFATPVNSYITEAEFPGMKELHESLSADYKSKALEVDRSDDDEQAATLSDEEL